MSVGLGRMRDRAYWNLPACTDGSEALSYGQLVESSGRLASALRSAGARPETFVAILIPPSVAYMRAVVAVFQSGAAYQAIEPDYPLARCREMIEHSGATLIVCNSESKELASNICLPGGRVIDLAGDGTWISSFTPLGPGEGRAPEQAAYLIYTSGSTGKPKGMVIETRNLEHLVAWHTSRFEVNESSRAAMFASVSFDASVWEMWPYLAAGARVHIGPRLSATTASELIDWIGRHGITHCFLPPALVSESLKLLDGLVHDVRVFTGGEALRLTEPVRREGVRLFNAYGLTETTVVSTIHEIAPGTQGAPPIGSPVGHTRVYVVDDALRELPSGQEGEIYIGGPGVGRGYLHDPGLTAQRFLPDPFAGDPSARMYRTGDRGRWQAEACLEFLGRSDRQVQVRGHRVEPVEIESHLAAIAGVRQAAVLALPDGHGEGGRLAAFLVVKPETSVRDVRAALVDRVPGFMVPAFLRTVDRFPLTAAGKRDDNALAKILVDDDGPVGPGLGDGPGGVEAAVAGAWSDVLQKRNVNLDDDFFELGGDSILLTRMCAQLMALGIYLSLQDAYEAPTLGAQCELARRL